MSQHTELIVAPRWGAAPDDDFYPWLKAQLAELERGVDTRVLEPPDEPTPTPAGWAAVLDPVLAAADLTHTVLLGHSVGAHALLSAITRLPPDTHVPAVVIAAGWWDIDRKNWSSYGLKWAAIEPWVERANALDDAAVRQRVERITVLLSRGDPIPSSDPEHTAELYRRRLGAEVAILEGRAHFNAEQEPAVLATVRGAIARLR